MSGEGLTGEYREWMFGLQFGVARFGGAEVFSHPVGCCWFWLATNCFQADREAFWMELKQQERANKVRCQQEYIQTKLTSCPLFVWNTHYMLIRSDFTHNQAQFSNLFVIKSFFSSFILNSTQALLFVHSTVASLFLLSVDKQRGREVFLNCLWV